MMLERLIVYARKRMRVTPEPGFSAKEIRWAIACDEQGNFLDVIELKDETRKNNRGKSFSKCPHLSQGELKAEGITKSHFLADTIEVVTLFQKIVDDQKTVAKHVYFKSLLKQASSVMPAIGKLADQVFKPDVLDRVRQRLGQLNAKPTDKVTFRIGTTYPVDSDLWHDWWRSFRNTLVINKDKANCMPCFASGKVAEPSRIHPKIHGLADIGGLRSGNVLIGFKQESFCSFGLKDAFNAAISKDMAAAYSEALNELIKKAGQRLAGTKIIHWFGEGEVSDHDDPLYWLQHGQEKGEPSVEHRAQELLKVMQTGQRPELVGNHYYAMILSGVGGRIMVRDWTEGQFQPLLTNIGNWFEDLSIVNRNGQGLAPSPKLLAILSATVRQLDQLPNVFVTALWQAALQNEAIPKVAVAKAYHYIRADILHGHSLNQAAFGLIKAYHLRKSRMKRGIPMNGDVTPYLNENHPHSAYQCGRLMAVFAKLQSAALGNVGCGVAQRYYGAASCTPALFLGRLVCSSQAYLGKLPPALARWYKNMLTGIWDRVTYRLPSNLTLDEQTLFALGYYQQTAQMIPSSSNKENQPKETKDG